jgi:release factor glutamine methyltransferase
MWVKDILDKGTAALREARVDSPRLDAEVLLSHVLRCERVMLLKEPERRLSDSESAFFMSLVARRAAAEPIAYLTGKKEFMGLVFNVSPAVLIPRPETELLVETAAALLSGIARPVIADVGTGSGAIAVSLAFLAPGARVFAVDADPAALTVAEDNAVKHGVADRVTFAVGDLLEPLRGQVAVFDLVAANLPYIPSAAMEALPPEVRREPTAALDGGPDGLLFYRRLVPEVKRLLKRGGRLLAEIDPGQARAMSALFQAGTWSVEFRADLSGRTRVVTARLLGPQAGDETATEAGSA